MSPAGLFVVGVLVTLTVGAAIALLVYAAILDGRDARARKAAEPERDAAPGGPRVHTGPPRAARLSDRQEASAAPTSIPGGT